MATARKRDDGRWAVQVYVRRDIDGKQRRKRIYGRTKREAELAAAQWEVKKQHVEDPDNMTVGQAVELYIQNREVSRSPGTIRGYRSILRNMPETFTRLPVAAIDKQILQAAIDRYAIEHSPKSTRNLSGLLTAALKEVYPDYALQAALPQKIKHEIYIPTSEEIQRIMEAVKGTNWETPIALAAFMGLRRSEIAALRWEDIDFQKKTLHVRRAKVLGDDGEWKTKTTKTTESKRTLIMPQPVIDALQRNQGASVCNLRPATLTSALHRVLEPLGIRRFNFHAFRHYYASVLLALNIPNKYAMQKMGHKTDRMLMQVYQHLMDDKVKETDEAIGAYFDRFK